MRSIRLGNVVIDGEVSGDETFAQLKMQYPDAFRNTEDVAKQASP
jgi:hypothetical protein